MERDELAALVAEQVVVVVHAGGVGGLVAGDPVADVDAVDQVVGMEELEDPVDAGPANGSIATAAVAQGVFNLKRAERAVLAGQEVDQPVSGGAAMVSRSLKHGTGMLGPVRVRVRWHVPKISSGNGGLNRGQLLRTID